MGLRTQTRRNQFTFVREYRNLTRRETPGPGLYLVTFVTMHHSAFCDNVTSPHYLVTVGNISANWLLVSTGHEFRLE